jgi:protein involved in polysaccharide export with SLBB domain
MIASFTSSHFNSFPRLILTGLLLLGSYVDDLISQTKYNNDPSVIKDPTGYKIRAGDKLRISVRGEPETNVEVLIDRDGKTRVAYLNEMKISGFSTKQMEQLLTLEYRKQLIFKNPIVNVYIEEYSDRVVFLSGSINRKGPYVFPPEVEAMNIVEVIARAGGFSDIARKDKVFITRTFFNEQGEVRETKTYPVNVEALSTGSLEAGSAKRFWIYPGDRIEVRERLF